MATIGELARHLCLEERRVHELLNSGVLPKAARGKHDLDVARARYIAHLRARPVSAESELNKERAGLAKSQRIAQDRKNAIESREYARTEQIFETVESEYVRIRDRLLAVPGKVADSLVAKTR